MAIMVATLTGLVALIVAFIAPLITHHIKISEFRQGWINDQRKDIADYVEHAQQWAELYEKCKLQGSTTIDEAQEILSLRRKAVTVWMRIKMRINPHQNIFYDRDRELLNLLYRLVANPDPSKIISGSSFIEQYWLYDADAAINHAQVVFKDEWEVTKRSLPATLYDRFQSRRLKINEYVDRQQGCD